MASVIEPLEIGTGASGTAAGSAIAFSSMTGSFATTTSKDASRALGALSSTNLKFSGATVGILAVIWHQFSHISFSKIVIIRDYFQVVGKIFASCYTSLEGYAAQASDLFGSIGGFIAVDFVSSFDLESFAASNFAIIMIGFAVGVIGICSMSCGSMGRVIRTPTILRREGHEKMDLLHLKKNKRFSVMQVSVVLFIITTFMMSIIESCWEIIWCDREGTVGSVVLGDGVCFTNEQVTSYHGLLVMAFIALLFFFVLTPFLFTQEIKKAVPVADANGKFTNADGELVPFTEQMYADQLENNANISLNPFGDLYKGFKMSSKFHAVNIIFLKCLISFICVFARTRRKQDESGQEVIASAGTAVVMLVFGVMNYKNQPFSAASDQFMDDLGGVTAVLTPLTAIICLLAGTDSTVADIVGALIFILNIVTTVVMVWYTAADIPLVHGCIITIMGKSEYHDSITGEESLSGPEFLCQANINGEVKHRVWRAFWVGLLKDTFDEGNARNPENPVLQRLTDLQDANREGGVQAVIDHWQGEKDAPCREARAAALAMQGNDIGTDEKERGKFYVTPYPFKAVLVPDNKYEVEDLGHGAYAKIVDKCKNDEETKTGYMLRRTIRAIIMGNTDSMLNKNPSINHPIGNDKKETILSLYFWNMKSQEIQDESTTYSVDYNGPSCDLPFPAGWCLWMKKSTTGADGNYVTEHVEAELPGIGLTSMNITDQALWDGFLASCEKAGIPVKKNMETIEKETAEYRKSFVDKHNADQELMCDSFYDMVYDNSEITMEELTYYLNNREINPALKGLLTSQADAFKYVFEKMKRVTKSNQSEIWYTFWDAFNESNSHLGGVTKNASYLDPSDFNSLAYNYMDRPALQLKLNQLGIKCPGADLDYLYHRINNPVAYPRPVPKNGPSGSANDVTLAEGTSDDPFAMCNETGCCGLEYLCDGDFDALGKLCCPCVCGDGTNRFKYETTVEQGSFLKYKKEVEDMNAGNNKDLYAYKAVAYMQMRRFNKHDTSMKEWKMPEPKDYDDYEYAVVFKNAIGYENENGTPDEQYLVTMRSTDPDAESYDNIDIHINEVTLKYNTVSDIQIAAFDCCGNRISAWHAVSDKCEKQVLSIKDGSLKIDKKGEWVHCQQGKVFPKDDPADEALQARPFKRVRKVRLSHPGLGTVLLGGLEVIDTNGVNIHSDEKATYTASNRADTISQKIHSRDEADFYESEFGEDNWLEVDLGYEADVYAIDIYRPHEYDRKEFYHEGMVVQMLGADGAPVSEPVAMPLNPMDSSEGRFCLARTPKYPKRQHKVGYLPMFREDAPAAPVNVPAGSTDDDAEAAAPLVASDDAAPPVASEAAIFHTNTEKEKIEMRRQYFSYSTKLPPVQSSALALNESEKQV